MTDRDSPAGRRDTAALVGYHARKFAELMELELSELQLGDQPSTLLGNAGQKKPRRIRETKPPSYRRSRWLRQLPD
jgi:hypothetical protein